MFNLSLYLGSPEVHSTFRPFVLKDIQVTKFETKEVAMSFFFNSEYKTSEVYMEAMEEQGKTYQIRKGENKLCSLYKWVGGKGWNVVQSWVDWKTIKNHILNERI